MWLAESQLTRIQMLIGLHVWTTLEQYEVLGVYGWFFGDFFVEDFSFQLEYSGIFRSVFRLRARDIGTLTSCHPASSTTLKA